MTRSPDPDGSVLLGGEGAGNLLRAAVEHRGGSLVTWALDHIDTEPGRSTTATFRVVVDWSYGRRTELLGVSVRAQGVHGNDERAEIFADGTREVAVWIHPDDPDLPGLARAVYPDRMAEVLRETGAWGGAEGTLGAGGEVGLEMVGYRPRRRAVVRVDLPGAGRCYVKVLRADHVGEVMARHDLMERSGVSAPRILGASRDHLVVLSELPGRSLAQAVLEEDSPCPPQDVLALLDSLPAEVAALPRRRPWSDAVDHYAGIVARCLPGQRRRLDRLVATVTDGLAGVGPGDEPTHGDLHEGQLHVQGSRVSGMLDIDTLGPGRRADDLACLVAHLSTIQRMDPTQRVRVEALLGRWLPVFDERVDPVELRLRAAGVAVSLATGPYRGQEADWAEQTEAILDVAEGWARAARTS